MVIININSSCFFFNRNQSLWAR